MKKEEARELMLAIAQSLRDNPPSFHYNLTVVGTRVSNSGGVGIMAQANAPGSTGYVSRIDGGAAVERAVGALASADRQAVMHAADVISMLATELDKDHPDKSMVNRLIDQIPTQLVGAAITVALQTAVRLSV